LKCLYCGNGSQCVGYNAFAAGVSVPWYLQLSRISHPYCKYSGTSQPSERLFHTIQPANTDRQTANGIKNRQTNTGTSWSATGRRTDTPFVTIRLRKFKGTDRREEPKFLRNPCGLLRLGLMDGEIIFESSAFMVAWWEAVEKDSRVPETWHVKLNLDQVWWKILRSRSVTYKSLHRCVCFLEYRLCGIPWMVLLSNYEPSRSIP